MDVAITDSTLYHVFTKIRNNEVIPVDFQKGVTVNLPKRGESGSLP